MKIIALSFLVVTLSSSSCGDDVKSEQVNEIELTDGTRAIVTTDYLTEGCEVLFEIEEDGEKVNLWPINLEDQYKVHGLELVITFHFSRITQSECQIGRPIVVDSIKLAD